MTPRDIDPEEWARAAEDAVPAGFGSGFVGQVTTCQRCKWTGLVRADQDWECPKCKTAWTDLTITVPRQRLDESIAAIAPVLGPIIEGKAGAA